MISVEFQEVELSRYYTEFAKGGPVFETAIVGNPRGAHQRNINRQDFLGEWEIRFEGQDPSQIEELHDFFVTKWGRAIGFRFFAPRDNNFKNDLLGIANGVDKNFTLQRVYSGGTQTHTRRIVKPIADTLLITVNGEKCGVSDGAGGYKMAMYDDLDYGFDIPEYIVAVNETNGVITFNTAPPSGAEIRALRGEYNVPVCFDSDRFDPTDYTTFSDWESIKVVELLPIALGIT